MYRKVEKGLVYLFLLSAMDHSANWGGVCLTSTTTNGTIFLGGYAFPLVSHFVMERGARTIFPAIHVHRPTIAWAGEKWTSAASYATVLAIWTNVIVFLLSLYYCGLQIRLFFKYPY